MQKKSQSLGIIVADKAVIFLEYENSKKKVLDP